MAQLQMPCPNPVACPGVETPTLNISSEGPDSLKFFGFKFFGASWGLCIAATPQLAALCDMPFPTNPPAPVLHLNTEQKCTIPCPPGPDVSYTVAAGTFAQFSQQTADDKAFEFACKLAQIICDGGTVEIFINTPQTCTINCPPDNHASTITIAAGTSAGLSQAEANADALALACAVAEVLCNQNPTDAGIPPFGGAGFPPGPVVWYTNAPQSCPVPCPDGQSTFHHGIQGNLFYALSPAAANAIAVSYACNLSTFTPACLSGIDTDLCLDTPYVDQITVSEFESSIWSIVSGELPLGLAFDNGMIAGTPAETGEFTFKVRCSHGSDFVERSYTLNVRAITTSSSLPDGTVGTSYSALLQEEGFSPSAVWSVIAGALPDGLTLHPVTGLISGTPTVADDFIFTVALTEGAAQCLKEFEIVVETSLTPAEWWTMEVSDPMIGVVNGVNMPLTLGALAMIAAAGKVNLAETQNTDGLDVYFARFVSAHAAAIRPLGNAINIFGWINITKSGVNNGAVVSIDYVGDAWPDSVQIQISDNGASGTYRVFYGITQVLTGNLPAFGSFFFFQLTLNTDGTISIRFNNGATSTSAPTALSVAAVATGHMMVQFSMGEDPPFGLALDELCIFTTPLAQSDIDGIYNGGLGRTWP